MCKKGLYETGACRDGLKEAILLFVAKCFRCGGSRAFGHTAGSSCDLRTVRLTTMSRYTPFYPFSFSCFSRKLGLVYANVKLVTYDTGNGPRAGVVVDGQVLDVATVIGEHGGLRRRPWPAGTARRSANTTKVSPGFRARRARCVAE
jgi:hypothetical protein